MKVTQITLERARQLYLGASIAIKSERMKHTMFQVVVDGIERLIQVYQNTESYTMTNRNEWNEDLFISPDTTYGYTRLI